MSTQQRVVLATRNNGKLREMQQLLQPLQLALVSQAELEIPSPEETGLTFVENALLKARFSAQAAGLPAIADDSGLVVPLLGGAPGIYSARYAGPDASDADNNQQLIANLRTELAQQGQNVDASVPAYFFCAMVYLAHADDPTPTLATAAWHGQLRQMPAGEHGFGYDPHFVPQGNSLTSAQLPAAEKNAQSHRGQASAQMLQALRERISADLAAETP
ncbi:MAG: RdgB/HAM1 family non-canonical purine NTP pyrophosphatase [Pseudomonadota bacterium]